MRRKTGAERPCISTRLYGDTSQMIIFFVFVSQFYFLRCGGSKFHYEFTNIKWIKYNSTPLPLSGVHTPQQNFTLQEGKLAHYRQGQYLRVRYDEIFGDTYSPDTIVTQTAELNRTKMSAQLTLAGLWHSTGPEQWNP